MALAQPTKARTGLDAIVVGGGHNGLVCAIGLARAGWSTLVVEAAEVLGGAVRTGELTEAGVVHDLFATNQDGFRGGPVEAELGPDLERHGLRWSHSTAPYANVYPGGGWLGVFEDVERTLAGLRRHDPRDAAGWRELHGLYLRLSPALARLQQEEPFTPAGLRAVLSSARQLGATGLSDLVELIASSTRQLGNRYLASEAARALVASWGMHLDYGPDVPGGALFPFIECFADMEHGMSIVEGGGGGLIDALAAVHAELGGQTRTGARVERILVDGGAASGVVLESGEVLRADRAVVASVTPTALYGQLLEGTALPENPLRAGRRFDYGPATMMIHLLLSEPLPWAAGPELGRFAFIHIAPFVRELAETYTASVNGLIPADPMLVVGQPTAVDPTRAPPGRHVVCVHVRTLPSRIAGDAAGTITARDWDGAAAPVAARALDKLASYAPGLPDLVLGQVVYSPADLERCDVNLVGGDSGAGSHHPFQYQLGRPFAGRPAYATPVRGLFLTGASSWPGAGVTGLPGQLSARRILRPHPWRALGAEVAGAVAGLGAVWYALRSSSGRRFHDPEMTRRS